MADYFSILSKTVSGLKNNDSQMREAVYERARATIEKQLRNMNPVPSEETISAQLNSLQEAAQKLESEFTLLEPETVDISPSGEEESALGEDEAGSEGDTEQLDDQVEQEQASESESESEPEPEPEPEETFTPDEAEQHVEENEEPSADENLTDASALFVIPSAEADSGAVVDEPAEDLVAETAAEVESAEVAIDSSVETSDVSLTEAAVEAEIDPTLDGVEVPTLDDEIETPDTQIAGSEPETVELAPPPGISLEQEVAQSAAAVQVEDAPPAQSPTSDALDAVAAAVEEDDNQKGAHVSVLDAQEAVTKKSGKLGCWIFAIILFLVIGGGGIGAWFNKDSLMETMNNVFGQSMQSDEKKEETAQTDGEGNGAKEAVRIGEDGKDASADPVEESDATSGETELAVDLTQQNNTPTEELKTEETKPEEEKPEEPVIETVEEGEQTNEEVKPEPSTLGEVAYLYEAGPAGTGAIRVNATVAWELKKRTEPVEGKADTYIQGKMEIPERDMSLNLVIDRNLDEGLSASHLIDIKFDLPEGFKGQGIDSVARFVMKTTEEAEGEALIAVPVKVKDDHFLIALDNVPNAEKFNVQLLSTGAWIDVPINYNDGKRALLALEKGGTGEQVFKEAFAAWAK